jgi:Helix-turn-helix domain
MEATQTPPADRVSALAQSLDCIAEPDLCLLAKITPSTAESWRKRGKGPAYVLFGNAYLYPRQAVAEYLQSKAKERNPSPAAGVL